MNKKLQFFLGRAFVVGFYLLLVVFLVFYFQDLDWSLFSGVDLNIWYLMVAFGIDLFLHYWFTFIWVVLLKNLGAQNLSNYRSLIYVYAKSWLGRYIPGKAPFILSRIYFASRYGISKNKIAISSLLEAGMQVIVATTLAFLMFFIDARFNLILSDLKIVMVGIVLSGIFFLWPPVFNFLVGVVYKLLKKKALDREHHAKDKTVIKGVVLYSIASFVSGLTVFFTAKSVFPALDLGDLFFIVGVANLSGAIGMLAIFAPSGLGVREGIQLILFSMLMPKETALLLTLMLRLLSVVVDLTFFALSAGFSRMGKSDVFSVQNEAETS